MTDTHKLVEAMARAIDPGAFHPYVRRGVGGESIKEIEPTEENLRQQTQARLDARAALRAIEASGYRVVPVEMTPEMRTRVVQAAPYIAAWPTSTPEVFWKQMLEIAPKVTP